MLLFFVTLVALTSAEDPLRSVLRSPKASIKLYTEFKQKNHLEFDGMENRIRYLLFRDSASHIADYNEDKEDTGHYGVNFFSAMSEEEKKRYHGLNITKLDNEDEMFEDLEEGPRLKVSGGVSLPYQVLWTNSDSVTKVKNQKSCGSCWTFATVGSIETRYKVESGILRRFSEQEFLDCAYDSYNNYNGCDGGTLVRPIIWSSRNGGRLAAGKDREYEKKDRACRASSTPDAMISAKIKGIRHVGRTEEDHLQALQDGAIAAVIYASDRFNQYDGNIMKDTTCKDTDEVNHGVTIVGYSTHYILIKNSWSDDWGEKGFARLARNHHNCKLYTASIIPKFRSTGVSDSGSDPATDYRPSDNYKPTCSDQNPTFCERISKLGCCTQCRIFTIDAMRRMLVDVFCRKTCGICGNADCPGGTTECNDGVCRHEHMCT